MGVKSNLFNHEFIKKRLYAIYITSTNLFNNMSGCYGKINPHPTHPTLKHL